MYDSSCRKLPCSPLSVVAPGGLPGPAEMDAVRCSNPARKPRPGTRGSFWCTSRPRHCSSRFPLTTNWLVCPKGSSFRAGIVEASAPEGPKRKESRWVWDSSQLGQRDTHAPESGRSQKPAERLLAGGQGPPVLVFISRQGPAASLGGPQR